MNNWNFDVKSAAIGGITTSIFQTAFLLFAIAVIGGMNDER